jgi:hypothetical protein
MNIAGGVRPSLTNLNIVPLIFGGKPQIHPAFGLSQ